MYDYFVFQSVFFFFHDFLFFISFASLFSSLLFSSLFSCLVSPLTCLFFFFSCFLLLFSSPSSFLSSSLSLSFTAHTETRSTRQVTPPTKNGHAPRDPLNQERAINLSILAMSHPGKFSRVESNQAAGSTPGGAHPSMPDFHVQRFICARPRLSQEILCIAELMTANCSAECPTQHMRRICSMAHISNTCNVPVALDMHIVTDS